MVMMVVVVLDTSADLVAPGGSEALEYSEGVEWEWAEEACEAKSATAMGATMQCHQYQSN
jgi:hypothetical protein